MSVSPTRFRRVKLPAEVPGKLLLHSTPGRYEPFPVFLDLAKAAGVNVIACLVEHTELLRKAPEYAAHKAAGTLGTPVVDFPIPDFGVPESAAAFAEFADGLAARLRRGETVLVHCGAGIGRTGMTAEAALMALGLPRTTAHGLVEDAGSGAETAAQEALLGQVEVRLARSR